MSFNTILKQMRVLYFILILAWLGIGTCISKKQFCGDTAKPKVAVAPTKASNCDTSLDFSDGSLDVSSAKNFAFAASNSKLKFKPSAELTAALAEVATYLENNTSRVLLIEGLYMEDEVNNDDSYENLGLARADFIKNYLEKELGFVGDQLRIGSYITDNACFDTKKGVLRNGVAVSFGELN